MLIGQYPDRKYRCGNQAKRILGRGKAESCLLDRYRGSKMRKPY